MRSTPSVSTPQIPISSSEVSTERDQRIPSSLLPPLDPAGQSTTDLAAEVRGTLLLFGLILLVTAGVAVCAQLLAHAVG